MEPADRSLVILLVDPAGQRSPLYEAATRAGHRPVVTTGLDTACVVLGTGLEPDVVVVRSISQTRDREIVSRLAACAPAVPIRLLDADGVLGEALEDTAVPLN